MLKFSYDLIRHEQKSYLSFKFVQFNLPSDVHKIRLVILIKPSTFVSIGINSMKNSYFMN